MIVKGAPLHLDDFHIDENEIQSAYSNKIF